MFVVRMYARRLCARGEASHASRVIRSTLAGVLLTGARIRVRFLATFRDREALH